MKRETERSTDRRIKKVSDSSEWDDLFKGGTLITSKNSKDCEFDGYQVNFDLSFGDMYVHPSRPVDVRLNDCVFTGKVTVTSRERSLTFENCEFHSEFDASDSDLKGKIRFRSCTFFESTNFENTKFKDLADFWRSTFKKETIFYKTDFFGTTVFSAAAFERNVLFTYSLIEKLIILRGTEIKKGLDLSTSLIRGSIGTFGMELSNFKAKNGKLSDEEFEDAVSKKAVIPIKNKRETFRILKQANIQQNNVIESIPYQVLEKQTLFVEQLYNIVRLKRSQSLGEKESFFSFLGSKVTSLVNSCVLFLNLISNWFGKAPVQSAFFTVLVGAFFFSLSMGETNQYDFNFQLNLDFLKLELSNFAKFLLPTHGIDYLGEKFEEKYCPTNMFYVWDWTGRIAVGFGIYQTIQAFRKFR